MVKQIKKQIWKLYDIFFFLFINKRIYSPAIIVNMDGGICSQMHQYLLGEIFRQKGYVVEYGLDFFKNHGMDLTGNHARNFDLLKAFPHLAFKEASSLKKVLYRRFMFVGNYPQDIDTAWINLTPPRYLCGYYADPDYLWDKLYREVFKIDLAVLDPVNKEIYDKIGNNSVAVHVRRGDLSVYQDGYGNPLTTDYFINAILYMQNKVKNTHYYFFSDDLDYVKNELIEKLPVTINYNLVDNPSESGYKDLILISKCKHVITSKGSLGKLGALFNKDKHKIIIASNDDKQLFMFNNQNMALIYL